MTLPKKVLQLLIVCSFSSTVCFASGSELDQARAYLALGDYTQAEIVCHRIMKHSKVDSQVRSLYLSTLSNIGERKAAYHQLQFLIAEKGYKDCFKDMEAYAWGLLDKAEYQTELIQLAALQSAAATADARAAAMIEKAISSPNTVIRLHAIQLIPQYRSFSMQNAVVEQLKRENNPMLRLALMRVIEACRFKLAMPLLRSILLKDHGLDQERYAAASAIASVDDRKDLKYIAQMLASDDSGVRLLGCEYVFKETMPQAVDTLADVIDDISPRVSIAAMTILSLRPNDCSKTSEVISKLKQLEAHKDPFIALTASKALVSFGETFLSSNFDLITNPDHYSMDAVYFASIVLAHMGKNYKELMLDKLRASKNLCVRANLALGLIRCGSKSHEVISILHDILDSPDQYDFNAFYNPVVKGIFPNRSNHIPDLENYPEYRSQMAKLSILNVLLAIGDKRAAKDLRALLSNYKWGVTANAAASLVGGDVKETYDLIKEILKHPDKKMRTDAALVLAFLGREPNIASTLIEAYPESSWETRINIIHALGQIGDRHSLGFLIDLTTEPFPVIQIVAAAAIIQTLYH